MSDIGLAFEAIHDRIRPRVLRYLTRLIGDAEAEDLTQSVMLKVSAGLPNFRGESSLYTWIYRIATNAAMDKLRAKSVQSTVDKQYEFDESVMPTAAQASSTETATIREEMSACIAEFVGRLPENYRSVMVLSELEGFKNEEIAAILGISLDTVKIRLHRAREKLRKELEAGCSFYRDTDEELACDRKAATPVTLRLRK